MAGTSVRWAGILLAAAMALAAPVRAAAAEPVVVLEADGARLVLDDRNVEAVRLVEDNAGQDAVLIELAPAAARALEKLTEANIDRAIDIRYAGRVVLSPIVYEPIRNGVIQISGISPEEAAAIVLKLQ